MINTQEKYGLKMSHAIALFVALLLNITWIVCDLILFKNSISLNIAVEIILFLAIAFYACYGYKKPHGNHMRYLLLCHSLIVSCAFINNVQRQTPLLIVLIWLALF